MSSARVVNGEKRREFNKVLGKNGGITITL